jgi:hypothetical protein
MPPILPLHDPTSKDPIHAKIPRPRRYLPPSRVRRCRPPPRRLPLHFRSASLVPRGARGPTPPLRGAARRLLRFFRDQAFAAARGLWAPMAECCPCCHNSAISSGPFEAAGDRQVPWPLGAYLSTYPSRSLPPRHSPVRSPISESALGGQGKKHLLLLEGTVRQSLWRQVPAVYPRGQVSTARRDSRRAAGTASPAGDSCVQCYEHMGLRPAIRPP